MNQLSGLHGPCKAGTHPLPEDKPESRLLMSMSSPSSGVVAGSALLSGTLSSRGALEAPEEDTGGLQVGVVRF